MSKQILVMGMHRSGTSMVSRILNLMGCYYSSKDQVILPAEDNPKGFWERKDVMDLNNKILHDHQATWDNPYKLKDIKINNSLYSKDIKNIIYKLEPHRPWFIKDPRFCLTYNCWANELEHNLNIVVLRNPLAVSISLFNRDKISYLSGLALWDFYTDRLIKNLDKKKTILCFYDDFLQDPYKASKNLFNSLKKAKLKKINKPLKEEVMNFVDKQLNRSKLNSNIHLFDQDVIDFYTDKYNRIKKFNSNFSTISQSFIKTEQQARTITTLNQSLSTKDEEIHNLSSSLSQRTEETEQQARTITTLNQSLSQRTEETEQQARTITTLNQSLSQRTEETEQQARTITTLNQSLSTKDEEIHNLFSSLSQRTEETEQQAKTIDTLDLEIKKVMSSNSYKYTAPLRELRRIVTNPIDRLKYYIKRSGTAVVTMLKRSHHHVPISNKVKRGIYRNLCTRFPSICGLDVGKLPSTGLNYLSKFIIDGPQNIQSLEKMLDTMHPIRVDEAPLVSVIIPVYGKINFTLSCLSSISENLPLAAFEVIVVDDCSPDNSVDILSKVKGIRVQRNENNQGFIHSCNIGAKAARGQYLYFLNNDTVVTTGWLDELLHTFLEFPGTGLVGSKLVYPDGRLQEAGGIIWQDGSAWNFGRYQDQQLPVYNYAREVDYCSGASIMVPKSLFEELGGFDEHYLPAYCEDADLALKIRDKGYRVIYQPLSTVIHYEGITSGTDTTQGTKAYQVENLKKLFERWRKRLATHQAPGSKVDDAKDRRATKRVLVLDHCTPTPNQDAGSVTAFNLMLLLREMDFQVTFIAESNLLFMPEYTTALQRNGIEVLYQPFCSSVEQHLQENGERYDLTMLFRPTVMEQQVRNIRKYCPNAKVLFNTVDLHYLRMSREAQLLNDKKKQKAADEMKQIELTAIHAADASIVLSTAELEILQPQLPEAKLHVFPLIMNIKGTTKGFDERRDIVFVGGFQHTPNVDAVKYFVKDVMPLLRKQLPDVRFCVVGSNAPAEINALASNNVIIKGFVEELTPLLDTFRVSVAPLRYGAGIKGKIGTAMAIGLPVVATPLAAEGMSLTNGENILIADGAEAFANTLTKLYNDKTLWDKISRNEIVFAEQIWGAEAALENLMNILTDLGIKVNQATFPLSLYSERYLNTNRKAKILLPIGSVKKKEDYEKLLAISADGLKQINYKANKLLSKATSETFTVDGFCVPCNTKVLFLVDMEAGGQRHKSGWTPNWRERLECPFCRMNNRQRLIATLLKQELYSDQGKQVYLMEQVTPIYHWAANTFKNHKIIGSEYLGHNYNSGAVIKGIRHEDVENLSFADGQLDLIVSNEVFEHVPNPRKAFAECFRALKIGGIMLATIPFWSDKNKSIVRAKLVKGHVENILPQVFHGNPLSTEGSLVFTDFGWDLLDIMKHVGFSDVVIEVYSSNELGHLGSEQIIFKATK